MEENISEKTGTTGTASKQTKTLEKGLNGFVTLFSTFFKIGAFTLGGGYAMIPLIESEVVDKHSWISKEEFLDLVAVAQAARAYLPSTSAPSSAINCAVTEVHCAPPWALAYPLSLSSCSLPCSSTGSWKSNGLQRCLTASARLW